MHTPYLYALYKINYINGTNAKGEKVQKVSLAPVGIEPTTSCLQDKRYTTKLRRLPCVLHLFSLRLSCPPLQPCSKTRFNLICVIFFMKFEFSDLFFYEKLKMKSHISSKFDWRWMVIAHRWSAMRKIIYLKKCIYAKCKIYCVNAHKELLFYQKPNSS